MDRKTIPVYRFSVKSIFICLQQGLENNLCLKKAVTLIKAVLKFELYNCLQCSTVVCLYHKAERTINKFNYFVNNMKYGQTAPIKIISKPLKTKFLICYRKTIVMKLLTTVRRSKLP